MKYLESLGNPAKDLLEQYQQEEETYVDTNSEKFEELKEKSEKEY